MKMAFNARSAKKLARAMEKALAPQGIKFSHGQALDALARMQGFADWNAWSASMSADAIDRELHPFELEHSKQSEEDQYGPEVELQATTGFALRYDGRAPTCEYVRTVDPIGREIAYWDSEEWKEDPQRVMGAILGSLSRGKPTKVEPKVRDWELEGAVHLYVLVGSSNEFAETPEWAKIVITQAKLDYLQDRLRVVKANKLASLRQWGYPEEWSTDEDEDFRVESYYLECDEYGQFFYEARPKHGDYTFETRSIELDELLTALKGPKDAEYAFCERHGHVIVWGYSGDRDSLIAQLRERKIDLAGFPEGYDGSYVENHCPECNEFESECICGDEADLESQASETEEIDSADASTNEDRE